MFGAFAPQFVKCDVSRRVNAPSAGKVNEIPLFCGGIWAEIKAWATFGRKFRVVALLEER